MSPSSVRRRPDGLVEIVYTAPRWRRVGPQPLMGALLLVAIGLFVSGRLPVQAAALILGCWIGVEFLIALDAMLELRGPLAEVYVLSPRGASDGRQSGAS